MNAASITKAGGSAVNYTTKRTRLQNALIAEYDSLGAVYTAMPVSFTGSGTNSGNLLYFYHPDHLGSSSLVTNADGAVTQHVEYVPFGEVFIEERNNTWNTPYLFNAKELDEETGLYYYGARYYDPKTSVWLSVDPLAEKYPNIGSYVYCADNPVKFIDPDGKKLVFAVDGKSYLYSKGNFWLVKQDAKGNWHKTQRYNPGKESVSKTMYKVLVSYRKIENSKDEKLKGILHKLENSDKLHVIQETYGDNYVTPDYQRIYDKSQQKVINGENTGTHTYFDFNETGGDDFKGIGKSFFTTVVHEMRHQYDYDIDNMGDNNNLNNQDDPAEIRAVFLENRARKMIGFKPRTRYSGEIDPKKLQNPPNNKMPNDE